MDKKNKYQFQPPNAKGSTTDVKKSQDVSNSKSFPKANRKRESVGFSSHLKFDQVRKPNAQKTKAADKRPKPKGYYYGSPKENPKVVEDESAELGSVMVPGSKKQNLNHLLNFHYAPRETQSGWNQGRYNSFNNRHYNRWLPPIQRHKYNKEQFLQANCQFVVTANGNYSYYLNNPDALIDWNLIQQIRIRGSENLSCPICLCPPIAGKMTRCGHVYCWPCILHYLALSDKTWRKCPICYEAVHKSDLKSVVEIKQNNTNVGDQLTLRLMRRQKGSLIAVPVGNIEDDSPDTFLSVVDSLKQQVFSKLLLANANDICDIIEAERAQLKVELMDDPHSPENCFIEQALAELIIREKNLIKDTNESQSSNTIPDDRDIDLQGNVANSEPEGACAKEKTDILEVDNNLISQEYNDTNINDSVVDEYNLKPDLKKFHYYYQAEDGQNIYLHAMNVKMLEMQYGSLEQCPRVIHGKLLEKEDGSLSEEIRRRLRYLCHLPLTCQFEIAELELLNPIISKDVMMHFEDQVKSRQKKRERRERDEKKREKKIAEEENKRMGKYPKPKVHIESHHHFPDFLPEVQSFENVIPTPADSTAGSSIASSPTFSTFDDVASVSTDADSWKNNRSFAETLRKSGGNSTVTWPSLASKTSIAVQKPEYRNDANPEEEEYTPPSYSQSLGDALAQAFQNSDLLNQKMPKSNGKKNKKKGKSTILFATTMARSS